MSIIKQLTLSLLVVALVAGGWFAFERWRGASGQGAGAPAADSATGRSGGNAAAGGGSGGGARVGRGGPSAVPVVAGPVEIDSTGDELSAIGTLTAAQEVDLFPQVTGIVTEIDFAPGSPVTAGQVLVRLDSGDQKVALDRAKIALDDAKAALDRSQKLAQSSNITAVALSGAKLAEQKAEIDLRSAQLDLDKRTMTAPFAGTIGLTDISVGDLVSTTKAIATLDDMSELTVAFETPERFAGRVGAGDAVAAMAEALPGKKFAGKIVAVDSRIDQASRTLKMKASLANEAGVLKPGMAVTVTLSLPGEPHPSVPSLSIQWDRKGSFVWKLNGDSVNRVPVTILDRHGRTVTVLAELTTVDQVIVEGVQSLREGTKVTRLDDQTMGAPAAPAAGGKTDAVSQTTTGAPVADAPAHKDKRS
jgi:RND family efflux transporter MFP subunit